MRKAAHINRQRALENQNRKKDQQERLTANGEVQQGLGYAAQCGGIGCTQGKISQRTNDNANNSQQNRLGQFKLAGNRLHGANNNQQERNNKKYRSQTCYRHT